MFHINRRVPLWKRGNSRTSLSPSNFISSTGAPDVSWVKICDEPYSVARVSNAPFQHVKRGALVAPFTQKTGRGSSCCCSPVVEAFKGAEGVSQTLNVSEAAASKYQLEVMAPFDSGERKSMSLDGLSSDPSSISIRSGNQLMESMY